MSRSSESQGGIAEYFTLRSARAVASEINEQGRQDLSTTLTLARQRAEAADALWSNGHTAEGLRLVHDAFFVTLDAACAYGDLRGLSIDAEGADADVSLSTEDREALASIDAQAEGLDDEEVDESSDEPVETDDQDADLPSAEDTELDSDQNVDSEEADVDSEEADVDSGEEGDDSEEDDDADDSADEPEDADHSPAAPRTAWRPILAARGLSDKRIEEVVAVDRQLRSLDLPQLDEEIASSHAELFSSVTQARRHADRALAEAAMSRGQLNWTRLSRMSTAALLLLMAAAGGYFLLRTPVEETAIASAVYGNRTEFQPDAAVDDDIATEWLLPDRSQGWVEVRLSPPRSISTVRLRNAHNRQYNDRGTHEYTLEVYSNGEVAQTFEGSWEGIASDPGWTEHQADVAQVDRIRFNVVSWHRQGGGLSEIAWDE